MSHLFGRIASSARRGVSLHRLGVQTRHYAHLPPMRRFTALAPILACTAVLAASGLVFGTRTIQAESLDPGPLKQDLLPDQDNDRYASKAEVDKVIAVLKKELRDDQVTTDPDELLGHGHSANTYHSGFRYHIRLIQAHSKLQQNLRLSFMRSPPRMCPALSSWRMNIASR